MAMAKRIDAPKETSRVAQLIAQRVEELKGVRTQKEIAQIVGYNTPNIITMVKLGETKLPLDRVELMAKALEVETSILMRLALEQFFDERTLRDFMSYFESPVTANEMRLIETVREATGNADPALDETKLEEIKAVLA